MAVMLCWEDMLRAQEKIKKEGYKLNTIKIPTAEEYKDPLDMFKEKYRLYIYLHILK